MRPSIDPELLLRHSDWVRALALDALGDPQRAEDVVQQTWVAALERRGPASGGERTWRAWLAQVARNFARMSVRGEERRRTRERRSAADEALPSTAEALERVALQREVTDAVLSLPSPDREIVTLRYFEELSAGEIARRLGLSTTAVHTRLSRARGVLRARLEGEVDDQGRAWALVLAGWPPSSHSIASTKLLGALLMNSTLKWSVAAIGVLLLALIGARLGLFASSSLEPDPAASAPAIVNEVEAGPQLADAPERGSPEVDDARSVAGAVNAPPPEVEEPALPTTASVVVRVMRSDDGEPAAGIGLSLSLWEQRDYWYHKRALTTDAEGLALFEEVPPGKATVYISRLSGPSTFGAESVMVVAGEEHEVEFEVVPGSTVSGRVLDFAGRAVAGADIWLGEGSGPPDEGQVVGLSDADGRFELRHVSSYQAVAARAFGYAPSRAILPMFFSVDGDETRMELELVLPALGGAVEGSVHGPDGAPLRDALVLVGKAKRKSYGNGEFTAEWDAPLVRLRTDERGAFRVEGVATGELLVRARAPGFATGEQRVQVPQGGLVVARLALMPAATLAGRVRYADGRPAVDAEIKARLADGRDEMSRAHTRTGEDGNFELDGAAVGRLRVTAESDEAELSLETVIETTAGGRAWWDAVLPETLAMSGIVVDADGNALPGWRVRRKLSEPSDDAMAGGGTVCDGDGRFRFDACPVAPHTLKVYPPGQYFADAAATLQDIEPGGAEVRIVVPLESVPRAAVRGRIVDDEGAPLAGVVLGLQSFEPEFVDQKAETGADGRFEYAFLPTQSFKLTVGDERFLPLDALHVKALEAEEIRQLDPIVLRARD